jgi:hypothetical protein
MLDEKVALQMGLRQLALHAAYNEHGALHESLGTRWSLNLLAEI